MTSAALLLGMLASLTCAPRASAQTPTREGAAQLLFDDASRLFAAKRFEEACPKFQTSQELDPKGGTLLNLALCREAEGRIATAYTLFVEARTGAAREKKNERIAFADKHIRALEPELPRLRIVIARTSDVVVRVDGVSLSPAALNVQLPVDPGDHKVEVTGTERSPWTETVVLARGQARDLVVPDPSSGARPQAAPTPGASRDGAATEAPPSPWIGYALGGAGVAALAVGTAFGARAFAQRSEAETLCAAGRCAEGSAENDRGVTSAWVANIGIGVGVLAVVAGLYLVLRSPSAPAKAAPIAGLPLGVRF